MITSDVFLERVKEQVALLHLGLDLNSVDLFEVVYDSQREDEEEVPSSNNPAPSLDKDT